MAQEDHSLAGAVERIKVLALSGLSFVIAIVLLFGVFWVARATVAYLLPEWRIKYALLYSTSYEDVTIQNRPTDCDFLHAPVGQKSCHYDKVVSTVRWAGSYQGPMVSYDEGNTWVVSNPPPQVKPPVTFVYVAWNKILEP